MQSRGSDAAPRVALAQLFGMRGRFDEAIAIAGRVPAARVGTVEVRPILELDGLPSVEPSS